MEGFRKTIKGIDFSFEPKDITAEIVYVVKAENLDFILLPKENGWEITGSVPDWIRELEEAIGDAIDDHEM